MKKKGNKKMPLPRQEVIDNPIPTSLFISDNNFVDILVMQFGDKN